MGLFKSAAHTAIAFGIQHCFMLALFLMAFFFPPAMLKIL